MGIEEFNQFCYQARPDLLSFALARAHNMADAEDAVAEAVGKSYEFFRAHQRPCPAGRDPVAYLKVTIRNYLYDLHRQEKTAQRKMARSVPPPPGDGTDEVLDQIVAEQGWQLVQSLPPRARDAALLRWQEGLELKEIASQLGVSVSTVRVSLWRTSRYLHKKFGDLPEPPHTHNMEDLETGEGQHHEHH